MQSLNVIVMILRSAMDVSILAGLHHLHGSALVRSLTLI